MKGAVTALQTEIFVRRYYECFNQRDFEVGERFVDPQAVFLYPQATEQLIGRAGYREISRRWVAAFPDSSFSIIDVRVHEGTVRTDWVAHGTHLGPLALPGLAPIPASGMHTHIKLGETIRLERGLIVEAVMEFDPEDLRRRLAL